MVSAEADTDDADAVAAPESLPVCAAPDMTDELAASAAAAIASGAAALPDGGEAEGRSVSATGAGMTTAMVFGAATASAACGIAVASMEELASDASPEDDLEAVFDVSAFEDFAAGCVAVAALVFASETGLAAVSRLSEGLLAVWAEAVVSAARRLSGFAGALSERRGEEDGAGD